MLRLRAVEPICGCDFKCEFWDRWMFFPGCFPERKISASCYIASRVQVEEALKVSVCAIHLLDIELITSLLHSTRIAQPTTNPGRRSTRLKRSERASCRLNTQTHQRKMNFSWKDRYCTKILGAS